ncbi:peptidase [Pengzhenrongella sicca]|uniref:Peptidase n=1 Tax=Pengzhenrongella sicca TaxID=2819238 RepID=A0A8A4ZDC6_9MICO|nr:peptidase [Pengzhenrongella sicca]QTE29029.1 peptidase [Pengzhenrongella sicca]
MIRRIALVAAAAVALVLAPTAAMAYQAPDLVAEVSDPTPAAGSPFAVTVEGATPNGSVQLTVTSANPAISDASITIAGTKSFSRNANGNGVAVFMVTLAEAGTYTLSAVDAVTGETVSTQNVVVVAVGAAAGSDLSDTGFDGMGLAAGAGALVLLGSGLVFIARRRGADQAVERELVDAGR